MWQVLALFPAANAQEDAADAADNEECGMGQKDS